MSCSVLVGPLLQGFFSEHLAKHQQVSSQTIASYRDTFRLLLQFIRDKKGVAPAMLTVDALDTPAILDFLESLEQQRGNCIRSRNVRLTAIRSFFRVVALREPSCLGIATQILAIPVKRSDKPLIGYVTRAEVDAILSGLDRQTWRGRRDHALLLTMFNTGARVSEMTALRREQINLAPKPSVHLEGKECHSYCISLRPRHETTGTHACRPACNLAFSLADVLLAVRKGTGLGPCTDAHGARRVEPMSEPYPA
jgi:integrase/recombinase XerD